MITLTLKSLPKDATYWSTRAMARRVGMSQTMVSWIWRAFGPQPLKTEAFKLSTDPAFVDKVRDVVGLYMAPPHRTVVPCVDEKPQIQALIGTAPVMPMRPGQPERHTHDYRRAGTTDLFAALDVRAGRVIGHCARRHRPFSTTRPRTRDRPDPRRPRVRDHNLRPPGLPRRAFSFPGSPARDTGDGASAQPSEAHHPQILATPASSGIVHAPGVIGRAFAAAHASVICRPLYAIIGSRLRNQPRTPGMDDTAQALSMIADALGISIETLRVARRLNDAKGLSLSENAELIRAFEKIEDVAVRRRVISYVQGEANRAALRAGDRPLEGTARP